MRRGFYSYLTQPIKIRIMLKETLAVQSHTYQTEKMQAFILLHCFSKGYDYTVDDGNIYITKGNAKRYPCIVAHTDTVHKLVEDLTVLEVAGKLIGYNSVRMEQTGIGGDDKVGIYIALACLDHFDTLKVAFFRDEEHGCLGSYEADMGFFTDCNFVLQCDRQGNADFITSASGTKLSGKGFQNAVLPIISQYGYSFKSGMMTDVMALKENGLNCVCANISCGYYRPHCDDEFVVIADVQNCLDMVKEIIGYLGHRLFEHKSTAKRWPPVTKATYDAPYCKDCWSGHPVDGRGLCKYCLEFQDTKIFN